MAVYRVLPIIDLRSGRVQFAVHGIWADFSTDHPEALVKALSASCAATRFDTLTNQLWVTVAKYRVTSGERLIFELRKFPETPPLTTLECGGTSFGCSTLIASIPATDMNHA